MVKKTAIDWKAVGRRLRELRGFETGQEELAEMLDISPSRGVHRTWKRILEQLLKHFENEPAPVN